jgi:hypothetical protein
MASSRPYSSERWAIKNKELLRDTDSILHKLRARQIAPEVRDDLMEDLEALYVARTTVYVTDFGDEDFWVAAYPMVHELLRVLREAETRSRTHRVRADHYLAHRDKIEMDKRIMRYVQRLRSTIENAKHVNRVSNHEDDL